MIWCNPEGEEHALHLRRHQGAESDRAANYLAAHGVGRGDYVMVILRRHYSVLGRLATALREARRRRGAGHLHAQGARPRVPPQRRVRAKALVATSLGDIADCRGRACARARAAQYARGPQAVPRERRGRPARRPEDARGQPACSQTPGCRSARALSGPGRRRCAAPVRASRAGSTSTRGVRAARAQTARARPTQGRRRPCSCYFYQRHVAATPRWCIHDSRPTRIGHIRHGQALAQRAARRPALHHRRHRLGQGRVGQVLRPVAHGGVRASPTTSTASIPPRYSRSSASTASRRSAARPPCTA